MDDTELRGILTDAVYSANTVVLTLELTRAQYVAVNKVLEAAGGKWSRKERAHVFSGDPRSALAEFLGGAAAPRPARTTEGFVPTPSDLASRIVLELTHVQELDAGAKVLEPSAGDGALVRAILDANPYVVIDAVEPNVERMSPLKGVEGVRAHPCPFEQYAYWGSTRRYDAVVMNPPFAVPGSPTLWIDHIELAYGMLSEGACLTSIAPAGILFRTDRKHTGMRELIEAHGGVVELDNGAFKEAGTSVSTVVVWLKA